MKEKMMNMINYKLEKLEELGMTTSTAAIAIDRTIYDIIADEICKELKIEKPMITVRELNSNEYGRYEEEKDKVTLNILLAPSTYIMLGEIDTAIRHITTLAHELRHKYQFAQNKHIFDNYIQPEDSMTDYKEQSTEIDAREYQYTWTDRITEIIINNL